MDIQTKLYSHNVEARGEEKGDVKERWYHLLLNLHLPVPRAVILPPQTLLPPLPGQRCSLCISPLWSKAPASTFGGKFKTTDMGSSYWRLLSWQKAWKEEHMQGKTRCCFVIAESCLLSFQNSVSGPVPLDFMLLFLLVSCPPATENQQGNLNF